MRIVLATWGTRGDVQPFVCLGRALADRGHEVEVLASPGGEDMIRAAGLSYRALPLDWQAVLRTRPAQRMLAAGRFAAFARWLGDQEKTCAAELRQALVKGTQSADLLLSGVLLLGRCRAIAEARRIPVLPMYLTPVISSRTYVSSVLPQRDLGPALNRLSHQLANLVYWRAQRKELATLHRELGLESPSWSAFKWNHWRAPCLLGYSQVLFPMPDDWSASAHPVGLVRPWPELRARLGEVGVPDELDAWLDAGPPPVFLGFGSMPVLNKKAMLRTIRTALGDLGVRGVLAAGWSEWNTATDDTLFFINEVDHQSLLPRCAAAVHHGGSGTTAASVGAGIPTLVCSVFADQPFWGARCRRLGIGDTLPFAKLNARRLANGLRAVLSPPVSARAREVARRMAEEDGVGAAVAYLDRPQRGRYS